MSSPDNAELIRKIDLVYEKFTVMGLKKFERVGSEAQLCTEFINNVFNHTIVEKGKIVPNNAQDILNTVCVLKLLEV